MPKKIILIFAFVALLFTTATGAFIAGMLYTRPLAEQMVLRLAGQQSTATAQPQQQQVESTAMPQQIPVVQKKGACGETGVMRLLFTGADFSMGIPPLGADAVRLVTVDFDEGKIAAAAFPRDLLVQTPGLADLNITQSPLGLAYHARKMATAGADKHRITLATELLAQTLADNFAYPPTAEDYYYFTLQLDEVGKMIDKTGGVELDLAQPITTDRGVTFPAGRQTLDGSLSVEFVRAYLPGGDPARLKRQNQFMQALRQRVLDVNLLPQIPELYKEFDKAIVTSLSPKQLQSLACMVDAVPQDKIELHEIGVDNGLATAGQGALLIPNVDKIKAVLVDWLGE